MQNTSDRTMKTIRMNEDAYYQARVASVMARKSLGEWLEEAIREKLDRESQALHHQNEPQSKRSRSTA